MDGADGWPWRWPPWVAAAMLILVVVVAAALLLPITGGDIVATARLEPLADVPAAQAELVADGDQRRLEIDEIVLPAIDGYYELWLMTREGDALISLGPVGDRASAQVPAAIDLQRFAVIDVSREPLDGDPGHSTDSVLRGVLEPGS